MARKEGSSAQPPDKVKVQATSPGYYNHIRRYQGDVFIADGSLFFTPEGGRKSGPKWMRLVTDDTPVSLTTGRQHLADEHKEIRAVRQKPGQKIGLAPNPGARVRFSDEDDEVEFRGVHASELASGDENPLGATND